MNIYKLASKYLGLLCLMVFASCGGGGDGGQVIQTPTAIKGVYIGAIASNEFFSVVTPDLDWYSLHFRSTASIDIYSGKLKLGANGGAASTGTGLLAYMNNELRTGSASLTDATLQMYSGVLNLDSKSGFPAQSLSVSVRVPGTGIYQASRQAQNSDLQGLWLGIWSDGLSKTGDASVAISASGELTLTGSGLVNHCGFTAMLTPITDVNIYTAVISIPPLTGCERTSNKPNGVVLRGVAVVYVSPTSGKMRLDLIAVDSTGSGISFRGDR